jgi:Leucine-rich repeat (LRR) protein
MQQAKLRIQQWIEKSDINIKLDLENLELTELPKLPDNLKYLTCSNNKLSSLPKLPTNLEFLNCSSNFTTFAN